MPPIFLENTSNLLGGGSRCNCLWRLPLMCVQDLPRSPMALWDWDTEPATLTLQQVQAAFHSPHTQAAMQVAAHLLEPMTDSPAQEPVHGQHGVHGNSLAQRTGPGEVDTGLSKESSILTTVPVSETGTGAGPGLGSSAGAGAAIQTEVNSAGAQQCVAMGASLEQPQPLAGGPMAPVQIPFSSRPATAQLLRAGPGQGQGQGVQGHPLLPQPASAPALAGQRSGSGSLGRGGTGTAAGPGDRGGGWGGGGRGGGGGGGGGRVPPPAPPLLPSLRKLARRDIFYDNSFGRAPGLRRTREWGGLAYVIHDFPSLHRFVCELSLI